MSVITKTSSKFNLRGQLLEFIIKDNYKIKYLRIDSDKEYWIKPSKEIRHQLTQKITPGCWVEVSGETKLSIKTGKLKLKADSVRLVANIDSNTEEKFFPNLENNLTNRQPAKKPQSCILLCQKSDCWKRGGKAVCQILEENLRERGLEDQVQIKRTGCLKQCKQGPNLVIMPDKKRYSNLKPQQIPTLIEKHLQQITTK